MPYKITAADAKASEELRAISSACPNSTRFLSLLNQAQRRLSRRGDFLDSDQIIQFCVNGCMITWPRYVGAVRGARIGNHHIARVLNNWPRFIGPYHQQSCFHGELILEDAGTAPVYNDIFGTTGAYLRYQVVKQSDLGKTITIFGKQYGNQPLMERDGAGLWTNGMTLTAATPYGTNATLVTNVEAITRQATEGMAYLFQYDPVTGDTIDMAEFAPNETNPRYRRSCIVGGHGLHGCRDANDVCWRTVEALIKLEFIPLVNDRDFLMIDNLDALKLAIQAVKSEEEDDEKTSEIKWAKAIRELNFEWRDKFPDQTTPVQVTAVEGCTIRNPT